MHSTEDNARRLVRSLSLLLGIREQDIANPTTPNNIAGFVGQRIDDLQAQVKSWRLLEQQARKQAQAACEDKGRAIAELEGLQAQVKAWQQEEHQRRQERDEARAQAQSVHEDKLRSIAASNPDSYRSIALANGAKECNVYFHDEKTVVVVEMAPNRSMKEVDSALQHSLPLAAFERIKLRELRPLHDGVTTQAAQAKVQHDAIADLERRIADLERSVRNNTRRLDLAAAACQLPEQWVKDISSRTKIQLLAERLGAGLKEKP